MYADWPPAALDQWKEERDRHGRLLFRGPRCVGASYDWCDVSAPTY